MSEPIWVVSAQVAHAQYYPIMQADPCVSLNAPSLGASWEPGHPSSIFFLSRGGSGSQREGCIDPDAGISPCANRMEKHAFQAHFDGKIYQKEHDIRQDSRNLPGAAPEGLLNKVR